MVFACEFFIRTELTCRISTLLVRATKYRTQAGHKLEECITCTAGTLYNISEIDIGY